MIRLFRLITGEEVVGELLESENKNTYKIKNPCILAITLGQNGSPTLNMQPWTMFSSEKIVTIKDEHVLFTSDVDIQIENKYNEIYGSGIVIAKQQPFIR